MAVGALFPALGPFEHYGIPQAARNVAMPQEQAFLADFRALRDGTFRDFVVARAEGLTAFPSFHTIMAMLFALAFRGTILHWPAFALGVLTIVATPVMGGHYFVDLLGGVAVFALTTLFFRRLGLLDEPSGNAPAPRLAVQPAQ